jgi:hypothetical protein
LNEKQNFTVTLILFNFVTLWILMISKVYREILVSFRLVQKMEISDLAMAKVEKINTEVT